MKRRLAAAVLVSLMAASGSAAFAGERGVVLEAPDAPALQLPRADTGKPLVPPAPPGVAPGDPERCAPPLPCGTRLLGVARRNGAVELQLPALRW